MDEVAPVANHYHVDVGCNGSPATHVLLIDREERRGYFAVRKEALQFLARFAEPSSSAGSASASDMRVPGAMVEITHDEITKLAHQLWERKGKPQGQDVQVWLEAEAVLKAGSKTAAAVR
jgi:hypothetical protein